MTTIQFTRLFFINATTAQCAERNNMTINSLRSFLFVFLGLLLFLPQVSAANSPCCSGGQILTKVEITTKSVENSQHVTYDSPREVMVYVTQGNPVGLGNISVNLKAYYYFSDPISKTDQRYTATGTFLARRESAESAARIPAMTTADLKRMKAKGYTLTKITVQVERGTVSNYTIGRRKSAVITPGASRRKL